MSKLLNDENFRHVNYMETDLKKTFARVRREQAEEKAKREAEQVATSAKVRTIKGAAK